MATKNLWPISCLQSLQYRNPNFNSNPNNCMLVVYIMFVWVYENRRRGLLYPLKRTLLCKRLYCTLFHLSSAFISSSDDESALCKYIPHTNNNPLFSLLFFSKSMSYNVQLFFSWKIYFRNKKFHVPIIIGRKLYQLMVNLCLMISI